MCLSGSIYVHSTSNLELLHTVDTLPASYSGICAISENVNLGKCYLAYPCSENVGHVLLMEIFNKVCRFGFLNSFQLFLRLKLIMN